jgi:hypothetical protein
VFFESEPIEDQSHEFIDGLAAVIPRDFLVKVPRHALNGIGLRCIRGQKVNADPMAPAGQVLLDESAAVEAGLITEHMDMRLAAQSPPEVVQQRQEYGLVSRVRRSFSNDNPKTKPVFIGRPVLIALSQLRGPIWFARSAVSRVSPVAIHGQKANSNPLVYGGGNEKRILSEWPS